jgi:hypothetical protein
MRMSTKCGGLFWWFVVVEQLYVAGLGTWGNGTVEIHGCCSTSYDDSTQEEF